jgi:hypothetical protein
MEERFTSVLLMSVSSMDTSEGRPVRWTVVLAKVYAR